MNRPGYSGGSILILIVSVSSGGLVWDHQWPGDPSGVWRPEPDPPGDQTAAPAARHDLGWATAIRFCHHRRGGEEGSRLHARTGTFAARRPRKQLFQPSKPFRSRAALWFLISQMDSASQQQLGSVLATQQEVLKNLDELRWVAVDVWTGCCFCKKKIKIKKLRWILDTP